MTVAAAAAVVVVVDTTALQGAPRQQQRLSRFLRAVAVAVAAADDDDDNGDNGDNIELCVIQAYHVDGPRLEAAFRKYFYRPDKSSTTATHQILVAHGNIFRFFALRLLLLFFIPAPLKLARTIMVELQIRVGVSTEF